MPGFDRTGPAGMGPMTGGGRGWCNPTVPRSAGYGPYPLAGPIPPRPFRAFLRGRPRWGRGFWGPGWRPRRGRRGW
jgi:hypothetical protein